MRELVKELLKDLLSSKKAMVTLGGIVASVLLTIAARLGWALTPEDASALSLKIMGGVAAYAVSQGLADHGVEAAQIHADAAVDAAAAKKG